MQASKCPSVTVGGGWIRRGVGLSLRTDESAPFVFRSKADDQCAREAFAENGIDSADGDRVGSIYFITLCQLACAMAMSYVPCHRTRFAPRGTTRTCGVLRDLRECANNWMSRLPSTPGVNQDRGRMKSYVCPHASETRRARMERRPTAFVASSSEHRAIAEIMQESLERDVDVTLWFQDLVDPSSYVLDDLVRQLDDFDFGIFVFAPEDQVTVRGTVQVAVRDNVLFEMGLFIGRLGKDRTFILTPRHAADMRTASDLLGLTTVPYDSGREDGNLRAALGPASSKIARVIRDKGVRADRLRREEYARQRAEAARARIASLTPADQIIFDKMIGTSSLVVINDDICNAASDVIVSSDDNHFTARGGVSKAILARLGPEVRQQLDHFERKEFRQGHLAVTTGGNWNRRAVIHAAVIDLDENRYPTSESIRLLTRRVLSCAVALGARTLALPVLGGGYATRQLDSAGAAAAVVSEVIRFLETGSENLGELRRVALYVLDRADAVGLADLLGQLQDQPADAAGRAS